MNPRLTPIQAIRKISAMYRAETAASQLYLINLIARVLQDDAEASFADEQLEGTGISIDWSER